MPKEKKLNAIIPANGFAPKRATHKAANNKSGIVRTRLRKNLKNTFKNLYYIYLS